MEKFEFQAQKGGRISEQEGGYAFYGISTESGRDILEDAFKHFAAENNYHWSVDLPPFKLTIEPMEGFKE